MARIKKHYHWLIAAIVLTHLLIYGGVNNSASLFLLPVSETFGVSRSAVTLPGSLRTLASFICSFFSGAILLRLGYRKSMTVFLSIAVAGLFILSVSRNMALYYVGSILFGVTESLCISNGATRIINTWFHRYRGTVLGLVMSATGLGGSLMCIILSKVMESAGWQGAYLCGALLLAVPLLLIPIFVRNRPEEMGLRPFGEGQNTDKEKENTALWSGFTYQQVIRSPLFYLLTLGIFLSVFFTDGVFLNLIPHLQDQGLTTQQAAMTQSVLMLVLAGIKIGSGSLSDAIGAKKVFIICLIAGAISPLLFVVATTPALALIGALFCAISLPVTTILIPLLSATLFGYQAQTSYLGILVGMVPLAGMVCPPIANLVFDRFGSYNPFFLCCAIGSVLLIGLFLILYKLADRQKARLLAGEEGN